MMRRFTLALLLSLSAAACGGDGSPDGAGNAPRVDVTAPPGGAVVSFGASAISAEIADEREEWARGLMFRERMDENAGMIFLFPGRRPGTNGFYMKNTLIPLSIAYMQMLTSDTYEVVAVRDMDPCPPQTPACPTFPGGEPYDAALEVNQGWFEDAGIEPGDTATVQGITASDLQVPSRG
jgi:uncharacterized membrane protein (UPF0127 family)